MKMPSHNNNLTINEKPLKSAITPDLLANKYLALFVTQLKNLLEYRMNILLKLVRPILMTAIVGSLWMVLFRLSGQDTIGGFTRENFIIYILIVRFIAVFSPGAKAIGDMNEEICSGNLVMRLVRPVHYLKWIVSRSLAVPIVSGIIGLGCVWLYAWLTSAELPSGIMLVLFIFSVIATIITQYAYYMGIGTLSFWVYEVMPIERFARALTNILSGDMLPLTIFGDTARNILQLLPFASLAFNPAGIYTGQFTTNMAIVVVATQYFWAILLWLGVAKMYRAGLKKFEAQGG